MIDGVDMLLIGGFIFIILCGTVLLELVAQLAGQVLSHVEGPPLLLNLLELCQEILEDADVVCGGGVDFIATYVLFEGRVVGDVR